MDAATDQLEIEQKYDAGPDFELPDLGTLPGYSVTKPETFQMKATYFDTDDLRLAANKVTLRRRTGGEDDAWHLKLPVRPGTRRERHLPLDADPGPGPGTVPEEMRAMVAEFTGGKSLRPIVQLNTTRVIRRLTTQGGQARAEVADDHVTGYRLPSGQSPGQSSGAQPATTEPLTWHEIEVELMSGEPDVLAATGDLLKAAGARPSAAASKLSRVLEQS